ncbi:LamG-like jellyroll fold domain-containing protein [Gelatiniphilus marinus]|uniref:LamG-like jellyroll fold domain-containing protein n=1 Tax=Gelatiniphilus marinus TaxID=1759464 RepID=A0ABW5JLX2_9FLAO
MRNHTNLFWLAMLMLSICSSFNLQSQTVLDSEDFESGWGIWNDGGNRCERSPKKMLSGKYAIKLTDDRDYRSSTYTDNLDLTKFDSIAIVFDFKTIDFEEGHDFFIEFSNNGGESWKKKPLSKFVNSKDFENNKTYNKITVGVKNSKQYTFKEKTKIRFRADAKKKNNELYLDNIKIVAFNQATKPSIKIESNNTEVPNENQDTSTVNNTNFGTTKLKNSISRTFTIINQGSTNLSINSITSSNHKDFTVKAPSNMLIKAGTKTEFTITFNALSRGKKTSTITVNISNTLLKNGSKNSQRKSTSYVFNIAAKTAVQSFFDSDGDGILDDVDIDDDNDGIEDSVEELACKNSLIATTTNYKFLNETFGTGNRTTINTTYDAITTYCYEDGFSGCFGGDDLNDGEYTVYHKAANGDGTDQTPVNEVAAWADNYWYTGEDHTPGDTNGRMAMFNASYDPGIFYTANIVGALPNIPITYSFWVLNLDTTKAPGIATRLRPNILVEFRDTSNNVLASISTGDIPPSINGDPANSWHQFTANLTLNVSEFYVYFINNEIGGGGNDLAIDDIVISQTLCDTDADGVADVFDLDSDNDGIPDVVEAGLGNYSEGNATLTGSSTWVDTNNNGMHDLSEGHIALDSDNDGTPNYLDLDSDNDTIFDVDESGATNTNDPNHQNGDGDITGDGVGDGTDTDAVREADIDSDGTIEYYTDGILDLYDYFNGSTFATAFGNNNQGNTGSGWHHYVKDSDNDGAPDYIDTTSDGSTFDISHTLYAHLDANNDGVIDDTNDAEGDGILDLFDTDDTIFGSPRDLDRKLHLYFDGRNDYAQETSLISEWAEISLMAWIKTDPTASGIRVIVGESNFYLRLYPDHRLFVEASGTNLNSGTALPTNQWVHVAATYSSSNGLLKLYVNGEEVASTTKSGNLNTTATPFTIGKRPGANQYFFKGFIDEVRLFNKALSENELQKMVHQEISNNAGTVKGDIIPKNINHYNASTNTSTPLDWSSLVRYYKMDVYKDNVIDDLSTASIDSGSGCQIFNTKIIDVQTAPLPFVTTTSCSGDWTNANNWVHGNIWGITGSHTKAAIVNIKGNIKTNSNHEMVGLILDNNSKLEVNNDSGITNSWYLKLNGVIDLQGESQLVQSADSDLDVNSSGTLERDQQGTKDLFTYNYWSSPVGLSNTSSNNNSYSLSDVLRDGTVPDNPLPINFVSGYNGSPGTPGTTAIGIASYWIWKFANKLNEDYASWQHAKHTGTIFAGEGYTMKGVENSATAFTQEQNYVFTGKPNNGEITLNLSAGNEYLIGNPYASAIDAREFILDNISDNNGRAASNIIDGALYFWDHFAGNTHVLREYQGGYATYNLMGGIVATSNDIRINASGLEGTKTPQQYIPVGQGFFVKANTGGTITFKNSQRIFKTEASDPSLFMKGKNAKGKSSTVSTNLDNRPKIRLILHSPKGYHRHLLVGADKNASNAIDIGYDALLIDENVEDLFWRINNKNFVIQGVNNFHENQVLPLGIKINQEGLATIKIDKLENMDGQTEIYLHDKELNLYHDLKAGKYNVHLAVGEYLNRFELTFSKASQTLDTNQSHKNPIEVYFSNEDKHVVVHNPESQLIESVEMINILGQSLFKFQINSNNDYLKYKTSQIKTGTYILKIETEYGKLSKKVLIK